MGNLLFTSIACTAGAAFDDVVFFLDVLFTYPYFSKGAARCALWTSFSGGDEGEELAFERSEWSLGGFWHCSNGCCLLLTGVFGDVDKCARTRKMAREGGRESRMNGMYINVWFLNTCTVALPSGFSGTLA